MSIPIVIIAFTRHVHTLEVNRGGNFLARDITRFSSHLSLPSARAGNLQIRQKKNQHFFLLSTASVLSESTRGKMPVQRVAEIKIV